MLKKWLKKWLEVPNDAELKRVVLSAGHITESLRHRYLPERWKVDRIGVDEILMMQQKFDALAEALGVVVVADMARNPPVATIASIRPDGLLGEAQQYINAVLAADKILGLQHRMMTEQSRLLSTICPRKSQMD